MGGAGEYDVFSARLSPLKSNLGVLSVSIVSKVDTCCVVELGLARLAATKGQT